MRPTDPISENAFDAKRKKGGGGGGGDGLMLYHSNAISSQGFSVFSLIVTSFSIYCKLVPNFVNTS